MLRAMTRRGRVLVAVAGVLAALAGAAPAEGAAPGEPGGVYAGTPRIDGVAPARCRGCKVRFVLTTDGLEITRASSYAFPPLLGCEGTDRTTSSLVRLRANGSWRGERLGRKTSLPVRGTVTRTRITVRGSTGCGSGRRFTARLRLVGHVPSQKGRDVACERLGDFFDGKAVYLVTQRDLGCGVGHDAARALGPTAVCGTAETPSCTLAGLSCAPVAGDAAAGPAAQTRCTRGAATADITRLGRCTPKDLEDYGAADALQVYAADAVGCADARTLGRAFANCDGGPEECRTFGAFRCVTAPREARDPDADVVLRCADTADARRVVLLAAYSSDTV